MNEIRISREPDGSWPVVVIGAMAGTYYAIQEQRKDLVALFVALLDALAYESGEERGERIRWCVEHAASTSPRFATETDDERCHSAYNDKPCRIVEKFLLDNEGEIAA